MDDFLEQLKSLLGERAEEGREITERQMRDLQRDVPDTPARNFIQNIMEAVDPTGGVATEALGVKPERPSLPLQLVAGIIGPGLPADEATTVLRGVRGALRDGGSATAQANWFAKWLTQGAGDFYGRVQKAISGAPSPELDALGEEIVDAALSGNLRKNPITSQATGLVESRLDAEMAARALLDEGDDVSRRMFSESRPMSEFDTDLPPGTIPFFAEGFESSVFTPELAQNAVNQGLADEQLFKFLLGID